LQYVVCIVFFGRDFHYKAIQHFRISCNKVINEQENLLKSQISQNLRVAATATRLPQLLGFHSYPWNMISSHLIKWNTYNVNPDSSSKKHDHLENNFLGHEARLRVKSTNIFSYIEIW